MVRKIVLSLIAALGFIAFAMAQNRQVSGIVTGADGKPVAGATVMVDGTTVGTTSGADGKFQVAAPANGTLTISFIGYETQQVPVAGKTSVDVVLKEDTHAIDDVIVVAYGTATKASLTGSVSAVKAEDIEKRTTTSVTSVIEGTAPGIQVNSTYGEPGTDPTIRIRGFGSVNGTNAPLYVVNGVIFNGNISDFNAQDIESITILKDAASAALYGNRAANGVIVITTKKGRGDRVNVRASMTQGIYNRGIAEYERLDADPWMETMWTGFKNYAMSSKMGYDEAKASTYATENLITSVVKKNIYDKGDKALFDANGKLVANALPGYDDLDWYEDIERLGHRQEYSVSADAAGEKWDVYSSFSYLSEDGYLIGSDFSRFTGRLDANFKPVKWFKTGLTLAGSSQEQNYQDSATGDYIANPFYSARMMAPVYPLYMHNADGSYLLDENGNKQYDTSSAYLGNRNIAYELRQDINRRWLTTLNSQVYGTITFLKDFQFTVRGDMNLRNVTRKMYNNPDIGDGASEKGRLMKYFYRYKMYTFQQQLLYNKDFAEKHHVDVLLAHENFSYERDYDYTQKSEQKLMGDNLELGNFAKTTSSEGYHDVYRTESYLGRVRYNYDNKYFAEASFRRDGSSRFHPDNRWGNFWSVGGSWMISKENFMQQARWVDNLKLRASYGEVGNDQSVGMYGYMSLYASDKYAGQGSLYKAQNDAADIQWETTASLDIGIDARLFDRWNITLDYFDKRSKDLLFDVYLPLSAGATDIYDTTTTNASGMATVSRNIGSVSNRGFEFAMDVDVIRKKDWTWNIGVNGTVLKNKIITLPDGKDIINGTTRCYSEGHGIYDFWTYKFAGVDQMTGNSLYLIDFDKYYVDPADADASKDAIPAGKSVMIGDNYYTTDNTYGKRDWSGSAIPDIYGGLSTSLRWRNLTLSVLCTYSIGGKVFDTTYRDLMTMSANSAAALHKDILKSWSGVPEGMTADSPNRIDPDGIPVIDMNLSTYNNGVSDRWLQDASYFVLKNINLTYEFPKRITNKMGIGGLALSFGVENAATITSLKGMNPQYSFSGSMDNTFVTARVFSFGINVKL